MQMDMSWQWKKFQDNYHLTDKQLEQFQLYYDLLCEWNEKINLTAITNLPDVLAYHYEDSLQLGNYVDFSTEIKCLADVGTGAGLPGIPLKIKYPDLEIILVEVTQKKIDFLNLVIEKLGLEKITTCNLDWRNFLRQTEYPLDLVCARASLRPDELVRMFQESSPYKNAQLVYWAAADWQVSWKEKPFFDHDQDYRSGNKIRKYAFFKKG